MAFSVAPRLLPNPLWSHYISKTINIVFGIRLQGHPIKCGGGKEKVKGKKEKKEGVSPTRFERITL